MKQITAIHFSRGSGAVVFLTAVIWSSYAILPPQNNGYEIKD